MAKPRYLALEDKQRTEINRALYYEQRLKEAKKKAKTERFWPNFRYLRKDKAAFLQVLKNKKEILPAELRSGIAKWNDQQLKQLVQLLSFLLERHHQVLERTNSWNLVLRIANSLDQAVRPLEDFSIRSRSPERIFESLQSHLYEQYAVPTFLRKTFGSKSSNPQWYLLWGCGCSPRKLPKSPIPISKRMAHELQFAPEDCSVFQALIWAQAKAIGITNTEQLKAVIEASGQVHYLTKCLQHVPQDHAFQPIQFWESIVRFFNRNSTAITYAQYGVWVDYLFNKKYGFEGRILTLKSTSFSLKGRTVGSLVRQIHAWHEELRKAKLMARYPTFWEPVDIKDFEYDVGKGVSKICYTIMQLTRQRDLYLEGKKMHHCVFSYIPACASGQSSIWKMEMDNPVIGRSKLLTIELNNTTRNIVQVRGHQNRLPTKDEKKIIQLWAIRQDLKFSNF